MGAFNSGIEEIVVGKPIIQTFGLEDTTTNQVQILNENLFKSMRSAAFTSQLVEPLVKFLNQFTYCLVAIQGGLMVLRGSISIGDIQAFFLYVGQVSDPLSRSSYIMTKFQETAAALGRIYEVIDTPAEIDKGTIADNIGYGKQNATREEIEYVARLAMADHFIRTLPDGYDTVLKQGGDDLSQGQRQLITIARAFLADPSILILDEATANVDTRTEVEVQKAMNTLLKGRTSIVIAHRLSTIKNADFLLVVENGTIVEQGTHDELMALNGYCHSYSIVFIQFFIVSVKCHE
ncbi:multidrug ABC transporter ATP-binding protein, partial [Candidatus Magnetoovum chiemensis]